MKASFSPGSTGKDLYDADGRVAPTVLRDIFKIIDRNGDGEIDADEIKVSEKTGSS
jgi:Ca2+-binding EF-hand superfamily protein